MKSRLLSLIILSSSSFAFANSFLPGHIKVTYFGTDRNVPGDISFEDVTVGVLNLKEILARECSIFVNFKVKHVAKDLFTEEVVFPLEFHTETTEYGDVQFKYDQYSIYRQFKKYGLKKDINDFYIIKTNKLGTISLTGKPRKVFAYANPWIQFHEDVPREVKQLVGNTVVFNSDQSDVGEDISFASVIAHELGHLLVQDDPAHRIKDDMGYGHYPSKNNLMSEGSAKDNKRTELNRKYQCPDIRESLRIFLSGVAGSRTLGGDNE